MTSTGTRPSRPGRAGHQHGAIPSQLAALSSLAHSTRQLHQCVRAAVRCTLFGSPPWSSRRLCSRPWSTVTAQSRRPCQDLARTRRGRFLHGEQEQQHGNYQLQIVWHGLQQTSPLTGRPIPSHKSDGCCEPLSECHGQALDGRLPHDTKHQRNHAVIKSNCGEQLWTGLRCSPMLLLSPFSGLGSAAGARSRTRLSTFLSHPVRSTKPGHPGPRNKACRGPSVREAHSQSR